MTELSFHNCTSAGLNLHANFGPGVHWLLGDTADGANQILRLATGTAAPERGSVELDKQPLFSTPGSRALVASALEDERLLPADCALDAIHAISPNVDAQIFRARLDQLGHGMLASKPTAQLNAVEQRTVALASALSDPTARVLALGRPFELPNINNTALASLITALDDRIVLLSASNHSHAPLVAGKIHVLASGGLVRSIDNLNELVPNEFMRLQVTCDNPRTLSAALFANDQVTRVESGYSPQTLHVVGSDTRSVSLAVLQAAREQRVRLFSLQLAPITLSHLQSAATAQQQAFYAASYHSAQSPSPAQGSSQASPQPELAVTQAEAAVAPSTQLPASTPSPSLPPGAPARPTTPTVDASESPVRPESDPS